MKGESKQKIKRVDKGKPKSKFTIKNLFKKKSKQKEISKETKEVIQDIYIWDDWHPDAIL